MQLSYCRPLLSVSASAQPKEDWTLQQCIDYAIENNISVKQFQISSNNQELRLNTTRNSRLPNVGINLSENASFGRGPGRDGTTVDHTQLSTSLGASASVTVFEGMRIKHDIAGQKFSLQASLKDLERAREDVSLNVTSLYLQVLLNKEMVKVAENQVELSRQQVERSELLVKNGRNPESDLYESKALLANDEMNLTQSRNTLLLSLLDLSQALNLENKDGFDIRMPDLGNITIASMSRMETPGTVYDYAVGNRPRILAEQLRLKSSEKALLSAKSAFYPSISLGAGYSNGYYFSIYEGARNAAFFNQLKNNGSEYIGLSINIPIFNRNATRNNVRMAQNNIRIQELAITEAQLALRKEIEQSYYSADAAYQKYLSAENRSRRLAKLSVTRKKKRTPDVRPSSTTTTPKPGWKNPNRTWYKPNSISYSAEKSSIFTPVNRSISASIDPATNRSVPLHLLTGLPSHKDGRSFLRRVRRSPPDLAPALPSSQGKNPLKRPL